MNQKFIQNLFYYDKETGDLFWKKRDYSLCKTKHSCDSWNTKFEGKKIITLDGKGYRVVSIFCKRYIAHRLIWLYVYGYLPEFIDHINGIRTDNRLCNLREVTQQQNHMNNKRASNNTSGATGVYLNKKSKRWCAQMKFNGKTYHLGSSPNYEEAVKLRKKEEKKLGFSERHGEKC